MSRLVKYPTRTKSWQENFSQNQLFEKKFLFPACIFPQFQRRHGGATTFLQKLSKNPKKVLTFGCKFGLIPIIGLGAEKTITISNLFLAW
jgi:hypothetical protein